MSKLIDIKMFVRPRNRDGERITINGNSYSYTQEAGHAAKADKAKQSEKSVFSEQTHYADYALVTSRAYYADKAQEIAEGSEFFDFLRDNYLSKVSPDQAKEVITYVKGILFGRDHGVDGEGNARLASVDIGGYKEKLSGGVFKMKDGRSYMEVDNLYVRMKAYFDTLEIVKTLYTGGNRIAGRGGIRVTRIEDKGTAWRCYFTQEVDGVQIKNPFVANDYAIAIEYNVQGSNHYLWRLVTSVGKDWINLSKSNCAAGSDAPLAGDCLCQLGNLSDPARQCAIMESTVGSGTPSYVLLQGINSYSLDGKDILAMGFDDEKHEAYLRNYGSAYIGDREGKSYLRHSKDGLEIKGAKISITAEDGNTLPLDGYIKKRTAAIDLSVKEYTPQRNLLRGTSFRFASEIPQNNKEHPATLSPETYKGSGVVDINVNESENVYSGIYYARIRGVAGKRLTLSFMTKTITKPDAMGAEVKAYKSDWEPSDIKFRLAEYYIAENNEWQLHSITFDVPGDTEHLDIPSYIAKSGHALSARPMLEESSEYRGWTPSPLDDIDAVKRCGVNVNAERIELDGKSVFKNGHAPEVPLFDEKGKVNPSLSAAQYLMEVLKSMETVIDGGLVMAGLIAAKDAGGNVTAYLNGLRQKMYALAAGVKNFGKDNETSLSHIGFDGSAQFGNLGIAYDGRVSIIDEAGKPRINVTPKELPSDAELLKTADTDITQSLPAMSIGEPQWEDELEGGVFTTTKDNSYVVLTGRLMVIAYPNENLPDRTIANFPVVALNLRNTTTHAQVNLDYWAFAGVMISNGMPEYISESTEFKCTCILPAGRWQLSAVARKSSNVHSQQIHFSSLQVNISHRSGAQALSLARNGWSVVQSEKQAAYVRDGKLCAVGAMNIPGILLAGTVNRIGQLSNAWGEFAEGTNLQYTSSGGVQVLRLKFRDPLPCGADYVAIVNPNDDTSPYGCMPVVRHKTENYCDFRVVNDSGGEVSNVGLDFMIIGRNK